MSYQLIELKLENYQRLITDASPLHVSLGPISGNDTTTLKASIVVSALSLAATATLSLEESMDGGVTWTTVTTSVTGVVNATGTWAVWVNENSGIVSPVVRLSLTPLGVGDTFYISRSYRTFTTDTTIVPRANLSATGFATEVTLGSVDTNVSDIETLLSDRLSGSLVPKKFDYIALTVAALSDTYVYKTGGAGGTTQKTVTVTFTDATKNTISTVAAT
jgi:hypothetical protein